jgi:malate synthase
VNRVETNGLKISADLHGFIINEALPGTGVDADSFFQGFAALIDDLTPKNRALLAKRDSLQEKIDAWHIRHRNHSKSIRPTPTPRSPPCPGRSLWCRSPMRASR